MTKVIFKETNVDLTDEYKMRIEEKFSMLDKYSSGNPISMNVEIARTTNHHRNGDVFRTELNLNLNGKKFYAKSEKEDLPASIDDVIEKISNDITGEKGRSETLFRRGARSVKKMMKGLTSRNPFTSKY